MTRLLLIRHARSLIAGRLAGRLDVPAELPSESALAQARGHLALLWQAPPPRLITSPALRCRQTAQALFPDLQPAEEARLQEQDFGAWEGQELSALPDLGPLSRAELAAHRPPGGEAFLDIAARTAPALRRLAANGPAIIITHAGVIRAALGLALGDISQGLAFEIAPFSATLLTALPGGNWSIGFVNLALAAP
ncbi:MAG TPA: histidine phosphatase family protein [Acidocella sp.]|nr:histidine phosphatase family protein [Acidocella sp.]